MSDNGNQLSQKGNPATAPVPDKDEEIARALECAEIKELWKQKNAEREMRAFQAEFCTGRSVKLPELPPVTKVLRWNSSWDDFEKKVFSLLPKRYHKMLDESCPRPRPDDPFAEYWERISRFIKSWLVTSISADLYIDVRRLPEVDSHYADEMWHGIKCTWEFWNCPRPRDPTR